MFPKKTEIRSILVETTGVLQDDGNYHLLSIVSFKGVGRILELERVTHTDENGVIWRILPEYINLAIEDVFADTIEKVEYSHLNYLLMAREMIMEEIQNEPR